MGGGGIRLAGDARIYARGEWDKLRPPRKAFEGMIKAADIQIVWGGNYFSDILPQSGKWLFWDKCQTMPSFSDGELAWTSLGGESVKKFTYNGSGMQAKEKGRVHPTQKPVALMEWCLGFLPNAETILDPFAGSGTTGVACVNLGRKFVGIEQDPDYFEIMCRRIDEAHRQADLFVEKPAARLIPVQEDLL
jgi:DNA modification methylase